MTGPPVSASGAERGECSRICRDGMRDVRVAVTSTWCPSGARAGPYTSHRWIRSPFRCTTHSRAVAGASRRNAIGRLPRGTRSQWPHSRHRHVVVSGGVRPLPIIGDDELRGAVPSSSPLMRTTEPGTGAAPLVGNGVVPVGPPPNPHRCRRVPTHRATEQRCRRPARKCWGHPGGRPAPTPSTRSRATPWTRCPSGRTVRRNRASHFRDAGSAVEPRPCSNRPGSTHTTAVGRSPGDTGGIRGPPAPRAHGLQNSTSTGAGETLVADCRAAPITGAA